MQDAIIKNIKDFIKGMDDCYEKDPPIRGGFRDGYMQGLRAVRHIITMGESLDRLLRENMAMFKNELASKK